MIPGVEDWKSIVAEIVGSGYNIQPSEFWRMDLNELRLWKNIVRSIGTAMERQMKKHGR
jgi:hypothetical protein